MLRNFFINFVVITLTITQCYFTVISIPTNVKPITESSVLDVQQQNKNVVEQQLTKINERLSQLTTQLSSYYQMTFQLIEEISSNMKKNMTTYPTNCVEALQRTNKSGIHKILVSHLNSSPLNVYCDDDVDGGGWLVIQRRVDGNENFDKDWEQYKAGFGDLRGNFFIGLEKLHALTTMGHPQELYILMKRQSSYENRQIYAKYSLFVVGNETEKYCIKELGSYSGDATDALRSHYTRPFSTKDRNNSPDAWKDCADTYKSGWWYRNERCALVNLNGLYDVNDKYGFFWNEFKQIRYSQMMIRPSMRI